eukprot:m51a1_g7437 hypothetical protein (1004) ;mRNA; r:63978-70807
MLLVLLYLGLARVASSAPADVWKPSAHDRVWLDGHLVEFGADPNYARIADVKPGSVFAFTASFRNDRKPQSPIIHHDGHLYDVSVASCAPEANGEWYAKDALWQGHSISAPKSHTFYGIHYRVGNTYHEIAQNFYCRVTVEPSKSMVPEQCEYRWDESHRWAKTFFDMPSPGLVVGCVMETNPSERPSYDDLNITQGHFYHFADNKHTVTWINSLWSGGQSVESLLSKVQLSFWNDDAYSLVVEQHFNALPLVSNMSGYWNCLASYESQAHIFTAPSFLSISDKDSTSFVNRVRGQFLDEPRSPSCLRLRQCIDSEWNGTHCVCLPGFEDSEQGCTPCPVGTYKPSSGRSECLRGDASLARGSANCTGCPMQMYKAQAGNTECTACPANSHTDSTGSVGCVCDQPNTVFFEGQDNVALVYPEGIMAFCSRGSSSVLLLALQRNLNNQAASLNPDLSTIVVGYTGEAPNRVLVVELTAYMIGFLGARPALVQLLIAEQTSVSTVTINVKQSPDSAWSSEEYRLGMWAEKNFYTGPLTATPVAFTFSRTFIGCGSKPMGNAPCDCFSTSAVADATGALCQCIAGAGGNALSGAKGCTSCATGWFKATAGNAQCQQCPPHSATNGTTSEQCACLAGYGADATASTCHLCVGSTKPTAGNYPCLCNDTNAVEVSGACACNAGFEGDATKGPGSCTPCPMGTFKNEAGSNMCTQCPQHSTTAFSGQTIVDACQCLAGFGGVAKSAAGCGQCFLASKSAAGNGECECVEHAERYNASHCQCSAGYQASGNTCVECPLNTFKAGPGFGQCTPCAADASTLSTGATGRASCLCNAGYGGDASQEGGVCTQCTPGLFKPFGNGQCSACPLGATSTTPGSTNRSDCVCNAGMRGDASVEGGTCTACPAGTFKSAGNSECLSCPSNTTSSEGASTCSCAAGFYLDSNRADPACTMCPKGSYKADVGNTECTQCGERATTRSTGAVTPSECYVSLSSALAASLLLLVVAALATSL